MTEEDATGTGVVRRVEEPAGATVAARRRAAIEMIARHEPALRRTARRYSLCADDADDAFQRALEILLTKAPSDRGRELVRWVHTVVKHEALAVRHNRERLLAPAPRRRGAGGDAEDWVSLIPAAGDGLDERLERRERIARSREALRALKPDELRALTLLAEGYSYAEIGEIAGFSKTKVNRCLAEGRERFRELVSRGEDGSRCREMRAGLSALCDGEASAAEAAAVREHLRACGSCRATMRAYRASAGAAAALVPALPGSRSLLERAQELVAAIGARLPGAGGSADSGLAQVASAGGTRGAGMAALAKLLTVCAGTAGGAACVAAGVVPTPLDALAEREKGPAVERVSPAAVGEAPAAVEYEPAPAVEPRPERARKPEAEPEPPAPAPVEAGALEYAPPPSPPPVAGSEPGGPAEGAAGEFGP